MKLSEQTIEILKNYATLNQSLMFRKGSVLTTITPTSTVYASSRVVESFPFDFGIYDLNRLLSKLSLYRDCELAFDKDRLIIKSADGRRTDYIKYSSPKIMILPPSDKTVTLDDPDHEFELSQEDLLWQRKSAGISNSPYIVFRGDGKHIYIQSNDPDDDSSDMSSTKIGKTDKTFSFVIKLENWKMLDGSYRVKLRGGKRGLSKFEHKDKPIEYFIAVESALSNL